MNKYLLDSNVFIQAHRMYYPFDVVPGFWHKLIELADKEVIISIDKVRRELCDKNNPDELAIWCTSKVNKNFFVDTSMCVKSYGEVANWAYAQNQYTQNAKDEFLATDLADPWLVAYAIENDCIIVTHETSAPAAKRKIKIPEACMHFGIRYITPIEMFRELNEQF